MEMNPQTALSSDEIDRLIAKYSDLPRDYLSYLHDYGWGTTPCGHMLYSGPMSPSEVYPYLNDDYRILIGDDMQGYCLGYDRHSKRFGEFSTSGEWSDYDVDFDLMAHLSSNTL